MKELLKLIETASPDDTMRLEEIDLWVAAYLQEMTLGTSYTSMMLKPYPPYTRCRTSLKAIRPEGWEPLGVGDCVYGDTQIGHVSGGWRYCLYKPDPNPKSRDVIHSMGLPAEELAELHAIIQAIEYERSHP